MSPEGRVSTFAGNHEHVGSADGPLAGATFANPVGVAVDGKGVVYVADTLIGIRRIADGQVSTLPVTISSPVAVAVSPPNTTPMLWVTNSEGLWRINLTTLAKGDVAHAVARLPSGWYRYPAPPETPNIARLIALGQRSTGTPFGVSVVDEVGVVYTDVVSQTVRYYNHETQDLQLIGGRAADDSARTGGGFADGPSEQSRFDAPMGIAARPDGTIAVADSGNRRIRIITNIDRLQPFYPFAGLLPNFKFAKDDYRIALVGASIVWGDGLFSESVGGQLEAALQSDPSLRELHKKPKVMTVRMGSDFAALRSYVDLLAESGFVDMVVIQLSDFTVYDSYGVRDETQIEELAPTWQPKMTADLAALQHSLNAAHMPALFVAQPLGTELTLDDQTLPVVLDLPHHPVPDGRFERIVTEPFAAANIHWLNAWPTFYADERSPSHRPIFLSLDGHFTPYGNALLGKAIAERLSRDKPWLHRP
jgi:lysophospholipase L1-like esterase